MKAPIVFMYSGQGSQYYQMGKQLYENDSRFRLWMNHVNEISYSLINESLIDILYNSGNKLDVFDNIVHTNPALIGIEYCLTRVLMERGIHPDYLLGYSLGEITASVVAGVLSLEQGLSLSVEIAKLLKIGLDPGGMLAIVSSEDTMRTREEIFQSCWVSCRNFDGNFVVAGQQSSVQRLQAKLQSESIVSQLLPVNYAFHTPLLEPVKDEFRSIVKKMSYRTPSIPIISSFKTGAVDYIGDEFFWEVTRFPVEFRRTILSMLEDHDYSFIDVGPSGTLATHVKYNMPPNSRSAYFETINRFGNDLATLDKLLDSGLKQSHKWEF